MELDFNHPTKSLLEQEQELLDNGLTEDDLSKMYPNIIGNGHPDTCLCPSCAPGEYMDYDDYEGPENFGYTNEELDAIAASNPNQPPKEKDVVYLNTILEEDLKDDFPF